MILSYNIDGNSDDSDSEILNESTSKSNNVHTELSYTKSSKHSRSSSARHRSSSNLNKLYDSKLFEEIFNKSANDSESLIDLENRSSFRDKKLSSDDIMSFKEENFLQKDIINLLNSSLKMQNTTNPNFSKESVKYKNYFNDSYESFNTSQRHKSDTNLMNHVTPQLEQGRNYDVSLDKSIISNISQNSRNYIPKILPNRSQENNDIDNVNNEDLNNSQINIEKFKEELGKANAISYIFNIASKEMTNNVTEDIEEKSKIKERASIRDDKYGTTLTTFGQQQTYVYQSNHSSPDKGHDSQNTNHDVIISHPQYTFNPNTNKTNLVNFNVYDETKLYIPRNLAMVNANLERNSPRPFSFNNSPYSHNDNVYNENFTNYIIKENSDAFNNEVKFSSTRSNNTKIPRNYVEMNDEELSLYAHIISKEQVGCRFLQKKIEDNPEIVNKYMYNQVYTHFIHLMKDSFANYFIQKIVEHVSQDKLEQIIDLISSEFMQLGLNPYGTRVIQKVIEANKSETSLIKISNLINPNILIFIKDPNANHIILKFVMVVQSPRNQFIYDAICTNIVTVSSQKHSCCALQKCIDAGSKQQKEKIFAAVTENTYVLITDPFGNYVLQYIITHGNIEINHRISLVFVSNIFYLSKQKFSSNVIEKCFDYCDERTKFSIVKALCETKQIPDLLLDMYGNYVLQKALTNAQEPYLSYMISSIAPHLDKLKYHNFGPKLYNKLISTYPKLSMYTTCEPQVNQRSNVPRHMNSSSSKKNLINTSEYFNPFNRMMPVMNNPSLNQMNLFSPQVNNNSIYNNNVIFNNIPYEQYNNYSSTFNFAGYYPK